MEGISRSLPAFRPTTSVLCNMCLYVAYLTREEYCKSVFLNRYIKTCQSSLLSDDIYVANNIPYVELTNTNIVTSMLVFTLYYVIDYVIMTYIFKDVQFMGNTMA